MKNQSVEGNKMVGENHKADPIMSNHIPAPEKMVCTHSPSEPIAALWHTCGKCGVPIDPVDCDACAGTGNATRDWLDAGDDACPKCYGYGIQAWRAAP